MPRSKLINRQDVLLVKAKREEYPNLKNKDLAAICALSESSTSRIVNGEYDHLLSDATTLGAQDAVLSRIDRAVNAVTSVDNTVDAYGDGIVSALIDLSASITSELMALRKLQAFAVECKLYEIDPRTNYSPADIDAMREKLEGLR